MATLQDLLGYGAQGYNLYQVNENLKDASHDIKQGFDQGRSDIIQYQQPYQNYGLESIGNVQNRGDFGFDFNNYLNSPQYNWLRDQGQQGVERSAAAKSRYFSGNTLADIVDYNQNFAANKYGEEFNRQLQGWQANTAKDLSGITTGAQTAQSMGTNLGDIAIGRGGSLASLHGAEAEMMNRQLNAIGAQLANSPRTGATSAAGGSIIGAITDAAGKLFDIDNLGNIFDPSSNSWLGTFDDIVGEIGNIDYGSIFKPKTTNNMDAITSLFGDNVPTDPVTGLTDYGKMFEVADKNGINALDLTDAWVNDDSWWDSFTQGISDLGTDAWEGIKSFFL